MSELIVYDAAGVFLSQFLVHEACRFAWIKGGRPAELRAHETTMRAFWDLLGLGKDLQVNPYNAPKAGTAFGQLDMIFSEDLETTEARILSFSGVVLVRITNLRIPE